MILRVNYTRIDVSLSAASSRIKYQENLLMQSSLLKTTDKLICLIMRPDSGYLLRLRTCLRLSIRGYYTNKYYYTKEIIIPINNIEGNRQTDLLQTTVPSLCAHPCTVRLITVPSFILIENV